MEINISSTTNTVLLLAFIGCVDTDGVMTKLLSDFKKRTQIENNKFIILMSFLLDLSGKFFGIMSVRAQLVNSFSEPEE